MVRHQVAGIVRQLQLKIERQQQETHETAREVVHSKVLGHEKSPPPPPPFPTMNEAALGKIASSMTSIKTKDADPASQEKCVILTVCGDGEQELDVPKSPSPDYSNSSSPIPFTDKEWARRPGADEAYGRKFGYQEHSVAGHGAVRKKAPLPPGRRDYPDPGPDSGGKYSANPSGITKTGVIDYDAGQISTSANGKVTIILREANHHGRMESKPSDIKNGRTKGAAPKLSKGAFPEIVM